MPSEKRLRKEYCVKMEWAVVVCRIVVVVSCCGHLIGKPAIHPFVKMRWFDLNQPDTQNGCDENNRNFRQREL